MHCFPILQNTKNVRHNFVIFLTFSYDSLHFPSYFVLHTEMKMTTKIWETGGIQQRIIDIINQCRYLSSKRGMDLKELRRSLREDEARQRQIIRQNEKTSQMQLAAGITTVDPSNGSLYPPWFAHINSHGMLYSQYNVQNYGQGYIPSHPISPNVSQPQPNLHNPRFDCNCNNCKTKLDSSRLQTDDSSEDNLMAQRPPTCMRESIDSSEDEVNDENHLVSLLYSANKNEKRISMNERHSPQVPMSRGRTAIIAPADSSITKLNRTNLECTNPLVVSDSFVECNLPVRKLASHDLTMLREDENNDFSEIMANAGFTNQEGNSESDVDTDNEISESEKVEVQVIEELDSEKRVVSPLIKKAESAFADLQKKDSIFGSIDDFGQLMSKANRMF